MRTLSFVLVLLAGCGLLIDVDPPDEDPDAGTERDAGERPDAVARDAGPNDDSDTPPFDGGGSGDAITFDVGSPTRCTRDAECNDPAEVLGPCERHVCLVGGVCGREPKPSGSTCDDGDACTVGDRCDAEGACGQPLDCTERNTICSVGMCDPDSGTCTMVPTPGHVCSPAPNYQGTCTASGCRELACVDGFADCRGGLDDGCETMLGTVDYCGECGNRCDRGGMGTLASCTRGECNYECAAGLTRCGSPGTEFYCIDRDNDPLNCGGCGVECTLGLRLCNLGVCVLPD